MTDRTAPLNDVLKVLKAGVDFYNDAAKKVEYGDYADLFRGMATIRSLAIADLAREVEALGEEPASAGWAENARVEYGEMRASLGDLETWVAQLEEHEDRTLAAVKEAMTEAIGTPQHAVLERHLAAFRETHDRMKALKDRLAV